jgi:hypothetical protein
MGERGGGRTTHHVFFSQPKHFGGHEQICNHKLLLLDFLLVFFRRLSLGLAKERRIEPLLFPFLAVRNGLSTLEVSKDHAVLDALLVCPLLGTIILAVFFFQVRALRGHGVSIGCE